MLGDCANCNCNHMCAKLGKSCTGVQPEEVLALYNEDERRIMDAGIGFCIGIAKEARLFAAYLSKEFEVYSVCCKNCGVEKDVLGLKKVNPHASVECMCNPKGQADFLNKQNCQLFVSAGLCVGHDALFARTCKGPVTTLVVKDRVLAHNPMSVVYSGYWKKKLGLE